MLSHLLQTLNSHHPDLDSCSSFLRQLLQLLHPLLHLQFPLIDLFF